MKHFFTVLALLLCVSLLSGCGLLQETVVRIDHVAEYTSIWELPERRGLEVSKTFPQTVEDKQVDTFWCKHTTFAFAGTGWQVFLSVTYTPEEFEAEQTRLQTLCEGSQVYGSSPYFSDPAYAGVWHYDQAYEYAVLEPEDCRIVYVYLQLVDLEDMEVPGQYVPRGFGSQEFNHSPYVFSVYPMGYGEKNIVSEKDV